jgi:hypothetical protein
MIIKPTPLFTNLTGKQKFITKKQYYTTRTVDFRFIFAKSE